MKNWTVKNHMDKAKGQVELLPLSVFSILLNWKQAARMSSSDNHLDHLFNHCQPILVPADWVECQ
jgi:hypothetical protein